MTENQRTARIEFVKKLLVANGFLLESYFAKINFCYTKLVEDIIYLAVVEKDFIYIGSDVLDIDGVMALLKVPMVQCTKYLRDFIKQSNHK